MSNGRINLIITTRYLPNWWDNGVFMDWDIDLLEIPDYDVRKLFMENPCVKTKSFGIYDVFVVPCLNKNVDSGQKGKYLEKTIALICSNLDFRNVYLCAHDKDFDVDGDVYGDFVKKDNVSCAGCHQLMELVEMKHAYMFAHDGDRSAVGRIVMRLADDELEKKDCESLVSIIDAEREMNDFFTSINANINTYPRMT